MPPCLVFHILDSMSWFYAVLLFVWYLSVCAIHIYSFIFGAKIVRVCVFIQFDLQRQPAIMDGLLPRRLHQPALALCHQTLVRLPRHLKNENNIRLALNSGIHGEVVYERLVHLDTAQTSSYNSVLYSVFRYEGGTYEHRRHRFTNSDGLLVRSHLVITRII